VKDTLYIFDTPEAEFIRKSRNFQFENLTDVSYELAHNIIYSAVEYAENLGFKPNKLFTETTSFFLEDGDNIPRIQIKCGDDEGKPLYVTSQDDSENRANQIIAQLEKAVGKGNFNYISRYKLVDYDFKDFCDETDLDWLFDEKDDDDDLEAIDRFAEELAKMSKDDLSKLFLDLAKRSNSELIFDDSEKLNFVATLLAHELIDSDDMEKELQVLHNDLDHQVVQFSKFPDSLFFGIQNKNHQAIANLFEKTFCAVFNPVEGKTALKKFKKVVDPKAPLVCFLELLYLEGTDIESYLRQLEKYHLQYPDYFFIQLYWHRDLCMSNFIPGKKFVEFENLRKLLSTNQEPVSDIEHNLFIFNYFFIYLNIYLDTIKDKTQALARLVAINEYLDEVTYCDTSEKIYDFLNANQIKLLLSLLSNKKY
jgi:hypothetical protein